MARCRVPADSAAHDSRCCFAQWYCVEGRTRQGPGRTTLFKLFSWLTRSTPRHILQVCSQVLLLKWCWSPEQAIRPRNSASWLVWGSALGALTEPLVGLQFIGGPCKFCISATLFLDRPAFYWLHSQRLLIEVLPGYLKPQCWPQNTGEEQLFSHWGFYSRIGPASLSTAQCFQL